MSSRFTAKRDGTVYAILLAKDDAGKLPATVSLPAELVAKAKSVYLLGFGHLETGATRDGATVVVLPAAALASPPCDHAWTFKLEPSQAAGHKISANPTSKQQVKGQHAQIGVAEARQDSKHTQHADAQWFPEAAWRLHWKSRGSQPRPRSSLAGRRSQRTPPALPMMADSLSALDTGHARLSRLSSEDCRSPP
jgi:hypothetical protein